MMSRVRLIRRCFASSDRDGVQQVEDIYRKLRSQSRVADARDKQQDADERFKKALEYKYQRDKATVQANIEKAANAVPIVDEVSLPPNVVVNNNVTNHTTTTTTNTKSWWQFWR
jgi:poly(3-hydroxybutyrate) depolymerase